MKDKLIPIIEAFWAQCAGFNEYQRIVWAMSTTIQAKSFSSQTGIATGVGTWGSKEVTWTMDFGSEFNQLNLQCECHAMSSAQADQLTAPCPHLIRAILQLEAKITSKTFEQVHSHRINSIIPF